MKPDNNPFSTYGLVAGVVGQVGCMVLLVILGALLLGLALDEAFGTRPTFLFIMLLVSIPISTAAIFFYARFKAKQLHSATSKREEEISE